MILEFLQAFLLPLGVLLVAWGSALDYEVDAGLRMFLVFLGGMALMQFAQMAL